MKMLCRQPDGKERTVMLKAMPGVPPVSIGRGTEATVQVDDPKCSRIHCAIRYWDDVFVIRDMNSRNGTFVNGEKIDVRLLHPGDRVRIGGTTLAFDPEQKRGDVTMVG